MPNRRAAAGRAKKACLWLVPFHFERPEKDQTGTFQMIVEAASPDDAMERCRTRLIALQETTTLFDTPTLVFSDGLVRLTGSFVEGLVLNLELPQPGGGRMANLMPDDPAGTGAMSFLPATDSDEIVEPFLELGMDEERESGPRLMN